MKVLLVNGSSRQNGCTGVALAEIARALQEEGIDTEMFLLGMRQYPTVSTAANVGSLADVFSMIPSIHLSKRQSRRMVLYLAPQFILPIPVPACSPLWIEPFIPVAVRLRLNPPRLC